MIIRSVGLSIWSGCGSKLNYREVDCIRQMANIASGSLKNIDAYERVYQVSIHDELTGLYNRTYCNRCSAPRGRSRRCERLLYMDMDNFKLYNDLYGEQTGDRILQWCAKRFLDHVENGEVFRVGSNEFLVSVPETGKVRLVELAGGRPGQYRRMANKPQVMQPMTFSVGVAWYPGLAADALELFRSPSVSAVAWYPELASVYAPADLFTKNVSQYACSWACAKTVKVANDIGKNRILKKGGYE